MTEYATHEVIVRGRIYTLEISRTVKGYIAHQIQAFPITMGYVKNDHAPYYGKTKQEVIANFTAMKLR